MKGHRIRWQQDNRGDSYMRHTIPLEGEHQVCLCVCVCHSGTERRIGEGGRGELQVQCIGRMMGVVEYVRICSCKLNKTETGGSKFRFKYARVGSIQLDE